MTGDAALAAIRADMARQAQTFAMDKHNLGRDLCKAATDGVQASIAAEQTPEGQSWAPLSEAYEEWKSFQFPGNPISFLHGVMDNPHEVAGEVQVAADHAVVTYGTSEQARTEATWFQEGAGRPGHGQPARPFWGFTSDSLKEIGDILDKRFNA